MNKPALVDLEASVYGLRLYETVFAGDPTSIALAENGRISAPMEWTCNRPQSPHDACEWANEHLTRAVRWMSLPEAGMQCQGKALAKAVLTDLRDWLVYFGEPVIDLPEIEANAVRTFLSVLQSDIEASRGPTEEQQQRLADAVAAADVPELLSGLKPCVQRAWAQWDAGRDCLMKSSTEEPTDREVWELLSDQVAESITPFETWSRYVRTARNALGQQKNKRVHGRSGRSVARPAEL